MIRLTITIPLASLPGVEVETRYEHEYQNAEVDLDLTRLSLVFEGEVVPDYDYEELHHWQRSRPLGGIPKLKNPRLHIECAGENA